jgi:hypothetical protein
MNPIESYTMEHLFEMLPPKDSLNGFHITRGSHDSMWWAHFGHNAAHRFDYFADTPKEALYNLVKAVRGE